MQQRLSDSVDDLYGGSSGITRLRQRLDEAVAAFPTSGVRTSVQYVGPLSVIDATLADHAEAVVREAVSNAVRHAGASTLAVTVTVDDNLSIDVTDNGRGISDDVTGKRTDESGAPCRRHGWRVCGAAGPRGGHDAQVARPTSATVGRRRRHPDAKHRITAA